MSELLKINVNQHTEKKGKLTYLSWAWAWAEVLKIDPDATWYTDCFNDFPAAFAPDGSAMVNVSVTIKGKQKQCWLPVMDNRNKAIKNPDAFAINTAIMRCLAKAIAMHGLGLYIYAGEDLPELDWEALRAFAAELVQVFEEGNTVQACILWYDNPDIQNSNEAREFVWKELNGYSGLRSAIKASKPVKPELKVA